MVLDPNNPQAGGSKDQPADDDRDKKPNDQVKKPDDAKRPDEGPNDPITPQRLTQVLDARQRKSEAQLKKIAEEFNKPLLDQISALATKLDGSLTATSDSKKKKDDQEPVDKSLVEYRRKLDDLEKKLAAETERRAQSERRERDYKFKTTVTSALTSAGCRKPEIAYLAIKPHLKVDPETDRVYADVESSYGPEELDLDEYIKRIFSEEVLPEVFEGRMRSGSPAGGDAGDSGPYIATKEEVFDPKNYLKDPDKYRDAIERGLVKGVQRGGIKK